MPLKGMPRLLSTCTQTEENPHCGNTGVPFMKSTTSFSSTSPLIFSNTGCSLINLGIPFKGVNVLEDEELREGIKAYSNWPTIPQLFVKGEFIGGCDIVREMYESGELIEYFNTNGINVQLANPE